MNARSRHARIRQQILREWRGMDPPLDLDAGIRRPCEQLPVILRQFGLQEGLDEERVKHAWRALAGEFIATHSQPHSIKSGELVLHCTQPVMRFHLDQMKPMLLVRLQTELGPERIRSIRFMHG